MKASVCIEALFEDSPIEETFQRLQKLGYDTIEFWGWWNKDIKLMKEHLDKLDMKVSTFCTKFISLVDASQHETYIEGLIESIETAKFLGVDRLITQVGNDTGEPRKNQRKNLIKGLKRCAPYLEASEITLMIEPLNTKVDHPGYYLTESLEAFEIIKTVGSDYVKVLYDIYHQSIMGENVAQMIKENHSDIAHFHAAGAPGRHELDSGEVDYNEVFKVIKSTATCAYIGLEYFPLLSPESGLESVKEMMRLL